MPLSLNLLFPITIYISGQSCSGKIHQALQLLAIQKSPTFVVVNAERLPDYVSYPVYSYNYQDVVVPKHILVPPKN